MRPRASSSLLVVSAWAWAACASLAGMPHAGAEPAAATATAQVEPTLARYFAELERLRLLDRATGTQDALAEEVRRSETLLGAKEPARAAVVLYGAVESPRFEALSDLPVFQNAEYDLVVALVGAGAQDRALTAAERVLRRGPASPYWAAAHRRAIDLALAGRRWAEILGRLEAIPIQGNLPDEAAGERAYLRGRVLLVGGKLDDAARELALVSRKSRLYGSAVYLKGVIAVRRGALADAAGSFCAVAGVKDGDELTFLIDDRYFAIKDLARLGLGRIAHEEGRYDDAYYHYFTIPEDSDLLPEALFEAAWSMYQKGERATARDLTRELLERFPGSRYVAESLLLAGYVELAECRFDAATAAFDRLERTVAPLAARLATMRAAKQQELSLVVRAIERERTPASEPGGSPGGRAAAAVRVPTDDDERLAALLELAPAEVKLFDAVRALRGESALAMAAVGSWRELARLTGRGVGVTPGQAEPPAGGGDAARLVAGIARLREEVARDRRALAGTSDKTEALRRELEKTGAELASLEVRARRAEGGEDAALTGKLDPRLAPLLGQDLSDSRRLADEAQDATRRAEAELDRVAAGALDRLTADLARIRGRARLGRVDAVIGKKRRLEREIEALAAGRPLPGANGDAAAAALLGDDEEYWPPEDEVWEDEYEGWR